MKTKLKHSEAELVSKAKAGDSSAFRQLVLRHELQVRTTVIGMLGDTAEAEDVAQEVFIRFFRALKSFRGEAGLATYLTRIAINLSLNEVKRRQRKNRILSPFSFGKGEQQIDIEDSAADPSRLDTKELVHKALLKLEPDFRSVIVLRMLDGYSVKETAEILQLPQGTIASRLARAQKKLKEILSKLL